MRPWVRQAGVAVVALAVVAGCTNTSSDAVRVPNPGPCTPVDVAAGPDTATVIGDLASSFNGSPAAKVSANECVFVRVQRIEPAVVVRELLAGWPDIDRLGPAPVAWIPGSSEWGAVLNARLAAAGGAPIATPGTPLARNPLVVAMPQPMARALGYPRRPVGWNDLVRLAHDRRGWGAYGHARWGAFKLGEPSPRWSTPALDATSVAPALGDLQKSVVDYTESARGFFDTWLRLGKTSPDTAMRALSAVITDARAVAAFNKGAVDPNPPFNVSGTPPAVPLVGIAPRDGTLDADNPLIVLDTAWVPPLARTGARAFAAFAQSADARRLFAKAGFARVNHAPRPAANQVIGALARWSIQRRPAHVLVLFDVSDSMGDAAFPKTDDTTTKLALAQRMLRTALADLPPQSDIGLRIFSTGLGKHPNPDWSDLVPVGHGAGNRAAFRKAISSLRTHAGSPLYAATSAAVDTVAKDHAAVDTVVLITDGANEDESNDNRAALLAHLAARPNVHVVTIAYGPDADVSTLRKVAQVTNGRFYDARDPHALFDLLPAAFAGF